MRLLLRTLILPACLAFTFAATAQSSGQASVAPQQTLKEGKVVYERTMQLQINTRGMDENMMRNLPRTRTDNYELQFAPGKSLWQFMPSATEDGGTVITGNGSIQVFRGGSPEEVTFTNLEDGKQVTRRELDAKNYLVEEVLTKLAWKLTAESKTIMGYVAHKAVAQQYTNRFIMSMENGEMKRQQVPDTVSVVAWFTQNIPVPAGPVFQGQLPGLILELEMNGGRVVYKAVEIEPKVNVAAIKEPKGGKRISAEAFAKERELMMEEMRKNAPAGRNIRMSTINN
jgi:GLPGLI family protein